MAVTEVYCAVKLASVARRRGGGFDGVAVVQVVQDVLERVARDRERSEKRKRHREEDIKKRGEVRDEEDAASAREEEEEEEEEERAKDTARTSPRAQQSARRQSNH